MVSVLGGVDRRGGRARRGGGHRRVRHAGALLGRPGAARLRLRVRDRPDVRLHAGAQGRAGGSDRRTGDMNDSADGSQLRLALSPRRRAPGDGQPAATGARHAVGLDRAGSADAAALARDWWRRFGSAELSG